MGAIPFRKKMIRSEWRSPFRRLAGQRLRNYALQNVEIFKYLRLLSIGAPEDFGRRLGASEA
jgi:hypothetical protein